MKKFAFALLAVLCITSVSQAATLTYELKETAPDAWDLLVKASTGDNGGLAAYGVAILNGKVGAAAQHLSPRVGLATNANLDEGPAGFSSLRTLTQSATGSLITGAQDTITPTPHIIYGFAQEASSFVAKGLTPSGAAISPTWESSLLLAKVTGTGGVDPSFDSGNVAATLGQVFASAGAPGVIDAQLSFVVTPLVPEPATLAMAGIGLIGLVGVARRRNA